MICTTYSRLGVDSLGVSETSGAFVLNGQIWGPEAEKRGIPNTKFVLPFSDKEHRKEVEIPDQMMDRRIGPERSDMYHCKLPEFLSCVDENLLDRRAHEAGMTEGWRLSIAVLPLFGLSGYGEGSFGWFYQSQGLNDFIVVRYWADLSPWYWWSDQSPWLDITGDIWHVYLNDSGHIMTQYGGEYRNRYFQFVNYGLVEDAWVKSEVYNGVPKDWGSPQWIGPPGVWLDLSGSQPFPPMATLFEEPRRYLHGINYTLHAWDFQWLEQHAFKDACEDIGKANDNMIQNLVGMAKLVWSVANGNVAREIDDILNDIDPKVNVKKWKKSKFAKSKWIAKHSDVPASHYSQDELLDMFIAERLNIKTFGDYWMTHRYEIQTAKMDLTELQKYVLSECENYLKFLNSEYHHISYGYATRLVDGVEVVCHCKIAWRPRSLKGFDGVMKKLHDWGLLINPYVLWDMLPMSFVADWFLPLGDIFEVDSDAPYYTDQYYDFTECSFSTFYSMEGVNNDVGSRYYRHYCDPPVLDGTYWWDEGGHKTSTKTFFKRVLDSGSILSGLIIRR